MYAEVTSRRLTLGCVCHCNNLSKIPLRLPYNLGEGIFCKLISMYLSSGSFYLFAEQLGNIAVSPISWWTNFSANVEANSKN
jgi:hypothetical protein